MKRPVIYEINAWAWLGELERQHGRPVHLGTVPAPEWDALSAIGADAVWLMGVWQRSPAGRKISLALPVLREEYTRALPGWHDSDVPGSPYCIRDYRVDERLGGAEGLASARAELARRGLRLVTDFVPNHTAPDHPWVASHPERFIQGSAQDLEREPQSFFSNGASVIAFGRDPYFPAWTDTAQVNAFHPGLRRAAIEALDAIAAQCDGVRCDMAMLLINSVFERTWAGRAGDRPEQEYWSEVIGATRSKHPSFFFMAEAYWDLEWDLQQLGFDYCYDKRLYDRLAHETVESVRGHLQAGLHYQDRLVRFIENHDEPRAQATFGAAKHRAVAVAILTLPGAKLLHDGQLEGRRVKLPVQLGRPPAEVADEDLRDFYRRLLPVAGRSAIRDGQWVLCQTTGWPDNDSYRNLLTWCWRSATDRLLVVVNFSPGAAQGRVRPAWPDAGTRAWRLEDLLSGAIYERDGAELAGEGLYVDLPAWGAHVLAG